ncbi:N-acetylmuramoyl-L-alanine amidase [Deinococcus koreensis]|uniref:N-acetylmuramoyl-L-alanine amidase n=1 Tax=Deinococcus koreensis TaxID=2054903 RepID=A0A2K3UYW6_9DEIO|nr:N-acetylmuramoyl-L-alanine amidase [Deinococcus koreensis]PNY81721.1 N-acetylmuramoyl-L-alanine amidase [Deinococcus koreensis]
MKRSAILLSSGLLLALPVTAAAQSGVPPQNVGTAAQQIPAGTPVPLNLTGMQSATFGSPRISSDGSSTRVVFDLLPGVAYTLSPTFSGLRLDVQGARVLPSVAARVGSSVTEYRAGGGQVTLITPFPLSMTEGWRASEATLATGARVLIVEISPTLSGGASPALRGAVRASVPVTADAQAVLNAPLSPPPSEATGAPPTGSAAARAPAASSAPPAPAPAEAPRAVDSLPPGDSVVPGRSGAALPPAPALPGDNTDIPSQLSGRVGGQSEAGQLLAPPRIGKNPGQTRVVFDLPPGTTYRLVPGAAGLRLELAGVEASPQQGQNLSPELRSWRFDPVPGGAAVTLTTATPTSERSGWRAELLPPASGTRSRLVIDLSPALADLSPVPPSQRVIAAVPPVPGTSGLAILALSASYVKPRVVIDPGHGGKDGGAVGSVVEKQVTLDVALRVRDLLRAAGVDVVLTRDTDRALHATKSTDLEMRAGTGTPGTQLFVSIHVNAMEARTALRGYGVETWWNPNHPLSSTLASVLQRNVVGMTGAFNQGLKSGQSLSVLRNSRIPAALVEIGYTSHPVDGQNLRDSNYLDRVAVGIAQGIREALVSGVAANGVGSAGGAGK